MGPLRVIVHAAYSFAMASLGGLFASLLAGREQTKYLLLVGVFAVLGGGVWGQFFKGRSNLSRPFGFFGGLIGGTAGIFAAGVLGANGWQLAGAVCRCPLCPGDRKASLPGAGLLPWPRMRQRPGNRRNTGAIEGGLLVAARKSPDSSHAALFDSIQPGLRPLALAHGRLRAPLPFIAGSYLIVGGLGRFVEESYRGEPQTAIIGGLRIYQWLALAAVVLGALVTTISGPPCAGHLGFAAWSLPWAIGFGLFTAFLMSVDFPESRRRFSRLAPP